MLQELDLSFNRLQPGGLQKMLSACWPLLCILKLRRTNLTGKGIAALAGGSWSHLQELDVENNRLGIDGMTRLSTITLSKLECIALDVWQPEFAMFTHCYAHWPRLARLHLTCVGFGAQDVQALVSYQWLQLTSLHLTSNYSLQVAHELAAATWPLVQQLCLLHTVTPFSPASVLSVDPWPMLTSLELTLVFEVVTTDFMTGFVNLGLSMLTSLHVAGLTQCRPFGTAFMLQLLQGRWPKLDKLLVLSVTAETLYGVCRKLRPECVIEDSVKSFELLSRSVWPTLNWVQVDIMII